MRITRKEDIKNRDVIEYVLKRYWSSKKWITGLGITEKWKTAKQLYEQEIDLDVPDYQKKEFVPYSYALVESVVAMLMSIYTGVFPLLLFKYKMKDPTAEPFNNQLTEVINRYLEDEEVGFLTEMDNFFRDLVMFGIAYLGIFSATELLNGKASAMKPIIVSIPPTEIYPEPYAKSFDNVSYFIRVYKVHMRELKKYEELGIYKNVGLIKEFSGPLLESWSRDVFGTSYETINQGLDEDDMVEIMDFCGVDKRYTIGARRVLLAESEFNIRDNPIIYARYSGRHWSYFSIGLLESIQRLQISLNVLRSQRRYNVSLALNKLFKATPIADIDINSIVSAPGNIIWASPIDAIQEMPISDVTASSYREEQNLTFDLQNVAGLWDYARGVTPRRRETATGIVRLQQASLTRLEYLVARLNKTLIYALGKRLLKFVRQNVPPDVYKSLTGKGDATDLRLYELSVNDLLNYIDISSEANINNLKEVKIGAFLQAYQILHQRPTVDEWELDKKLLEILEIKDYEEILLRKEQYIQRLQAMMQGKKEGEGK